MILYDLSAIFLLYLIALCLVTPITAQESAARQDTNNPFPHLLVRSPSGDDLPIALFIKEGSASQNIISVAEIPPQHRQRNTRTGKQIVQRGDVNNNFNTHQSHDVNNFNNPQNNIRLLPANRHALPTAFVQSSLGGLFVETKPKDNSEDNPAASQSSTLLPQGNEIEDVRGRENEGLKETSVFGSKEQFSFNNKQNLPFANKNDNAAIDESEQFLNENRNEGSLPVPDTLVYTNPQRDVALDQRNFRQIPTGVIHPYFLQQIDNSNEEKDGQNNQQNRNQEHQIAPRDSQEEPRHQFLNSNLSPIFDESSHINRETTVLNNEDGVRYTNPESFENSAGQGYISQDNIVASPFHTTGQSFVVRMKPTLVLNNFQPFESVPENGFHQSNVQKREPQTHEDVNAQDERRLSFQEPKEELQQNRNIIFEEQLFPNQERAKLVHQRSESVPNEDTQNFILNDGIVYEEGAAEDSFRPSYFGRALDEEESQIVPQGRSLDPVEDISHGTFTPGILEGGFVPSNFFGRYFRQ